MLARRLFPLVADFNVRRRRTLKSATRNYSRAKLAVNQRSTETSSVVAEHFSMRVKPKGA